jgi:hypothetical protein
MRTAWPQSPNSPMKTALVLTSIHAPNPAMQALADGCVTHGWDMFVAGDTKSPVHFQLDGCRFLSTAAQRESGYSLGLLAPVESYTRKNIGYLEAIRNGARVIVETDDDNHPRETFWTERKELMECRTVHAHQWVNTYRYFTSDFIYPRGLPLPVARHDVPHPEDTALKSCPIQQGLADEDPDVDAVYRMLYPLPFRFKADQLPVWLGPGAWCPFNSQNTTFAADVFPLMYLPAHCNFRMTDIWRSFVAQRVLHARGQGIMFHGATVWQERNDHNLHRDFIDEIPGYTHNESIRKELMALEFGKTESLRPMMERCYERLIARGWVGASEEPLLIAWFDDLEAIHP